MARIKFTSNGHIDVTVSAKRNPKDEHKALFTIRVKDDGIGMDEETQKRVFEPFTQADASTTREFGGTGLGLSISAQYIELMGGDLSISSMVDGGTEVSVLLPLRIDTERDIPDQVNAKAESSTASIIVKDEVVRTSIESVLLRLGFKRENLEFCDSVANSPKNSDVYLVDEASAEEFTAMPSWRGRDQGFHVLVSRNSGIGSNIEPNFQSVVRLPVTANQLVELRDREHDTTLSHRNSEARQTNFSHALSGNVLICEDVEINQRIASEMLEMLGFRTEIAGNGREALSLFVPGKYEVIFMDCQMPQMDGFEATRKIRRLEQSSDSIRTPIIALTAGASEGDQDACMNAGMDDYLTKPFTIRDIEKAVSQWLPARAIPDSENDVQNISPTFDYPLDEIINFSNIDSIREIENRTGKPLLHELFDGFVTQMEEKLEELARAMAAEDLESVRSTSHAIKSMSSNMGAVAVRQLASDIEHAAKFGVQENFLRLREDLTKSYAQYCTAFRRHLGTETHAQE